VLVNFVEKKQIYIGKRESEGFIVEKRKKKGASLMSFGGFIENSTGGGGARIVTDISYRNSNVNNHHNMPSGALAQPRLVSPPLTKSMFNSSPGLSLGLVRQPLSLSLRSSSFDCHHFFLGLKN
jgi:hypothetical protein